MAREFIQLFGVNTHNLKNLDVNFPLGQVSVVTGVSGSGKSSLVFDSLYGESYRRYVESLSSFARQYMKALPKPDIKDVKNLPPSVAVKQMRSKATSRSTVGTMTELVDLLRILITHTGQIKCIDCGELVERDSLKSIVAKTFDKFASGEKVLVLAPLRKLSGQAQKELKNSLIGQGFKRLYAKEQVVKIEDFKGKLQEAFVVIDRIELKSSHKIRLEESANFALKLGAGAMALASDAKIVEFSNNLECGSCKRIYLEPSPPRLSFNHPLGACHICNGFGLAAVIDEKKVIPDAQKSIDEKGIACWNFGKHVGYYRHVKTCAKKIKLDTAKPFDKYTAKEKKWLFEGDDDFEGIKGYFEWLDSKRYKPHYRIHAARYRKYVTCDLCSGSRLKQDALAHQIAGKNIHELCSLPIGELSIFLKNLTLASGTRKVSRAMITVGISEAMAEIDARLNYLKKVGLRYLTLDRTTRTLSGGEFQRINMARCLGNALTDSLFCLDEPSCGLHPRDSENLVGIIHELRDQGNTVVVVEHEHQIIESADHVVEIGPKAGHLGGEITYAGGAKAFGGKSRAAKFDLVPPNTKLSQFMTISEVTTHNLRNVTCRIPVGALIGICGVSGSGKTSLIQGSLYPLLAKELGQDFEGNIEDIKGKIGPGKIVRMHSQAMLVSQSALGRSSRSNIATYLGVYDEIRKILASSPVAKRQKLHAGSFSFNVSGGRCEHCRGLGTISEDLSFLGEMNVVCPECEGERFQNKVLEVTYREKNINEILKLTVDQAREFFFEHQKIVNTLDAVVKMGLGYLTLGQQTSSFSGGEAQRLKLISLIKDADKQRRSFLIFDEPSTGLSDTDVMQLVKQLRFLTDLGHTVLVVEHHTGLLRTCDWLIEIGPEAGVEGGEVVFEGPPSEIFKVKASKTAPFLR